MTNIIVIIAYVLIVSVATICRPDFLSSDAFIDRFAGDDLLGLLAIMLTITFASVANIHLSINQIVARVFADKIEEGQRHAAPSRREINQNAWLLFWAFVSCVGFLVVKGVLGSNIYVHSAINGLSMGSLLVSLLVFYDIYSSVFSLVASNLAVQSANSENSGPKSNGT